MVAPGILVPFRPFILTVIVMCSILPKTTGFGTVVIKVNGI
jgi:hypothetical protein